MNFGISSVIFVRIVSSLSACAFSFWICSSIASILSSSSLFRFLS